MTASVTHEPVVDNPKLTLLAFHHCQELTQTVETALLIFWGKWYRHIQNTQPVEAGKLDIWFISLAYHLIYGRAEQIWERIAQVGRQLGIPALQELPARLRQSDRTQLFHNLKHMQQYKMQKLLPDVLRLSTPLREGSLQLVGGVYPLLIHDTYTVDLTLRCPVKNIAVSQLEILNPQGCLLPSHIQASVGQTLLFAKPTDSASNVREVATASVLALLQSTLKAGEALPLLIGEGKLLGGDIFQYESEHPDPSQRYHILVWLATHPHTDTTDTEALEAQGGYYYPLLNLLLNRSKVSWAYYQARLGFGQAQTLYERLEKKVQAFSQLKQKQDKWLQNELQTLLKGTRNERLRSQLTNLLGQTQGQGLQDRIEECLHQEISDKRLETRLRKLLRQLQEQRLKKMEEWLIEMPQMTFEYARSMRDIQDQFTTITINTRNYELQLVRLKEESLAKDNLAFLEQFREQDCHQFQEQIRFDVDYLNSGKSLFEQMIEGIRGLVEIDAQKQQLANDLVEKERDRNLQIWFTVVGSGLAVSGLSATIESKPVEAIASHFYPQINQNWSRAAVVYMPLNIMFHVLVGFTFAILARGTIERLIRSLSGRNQRQE
jgi:hypothetical protein